MSFQQDQTLILTPACVPHKPTRQQENRLYLLFSQVEHCGLLFMWIPQNFPGKKYILKERVYNHLACTSPSIFTWEKLHYWMWTCHLCFFWHENQTDWQMINADLNIPGSFNLLVKIQLVDLTNWQRPLHNVWTRSNERATHASAGVRLMTSMTYAPEVTSGKSDCLSFSSLARLRWEKQPKNELFLDTLVWFSLKLKAWCIVTNSKWHHIEDFSD